MKKKLLSLAMALVLCMGMAVPAKAAMSIQIGEYVQMGSYCGKPILWRCVDIDENGPLMLSDKILCLKAFDAKGNNIVGSHIRDVGRKSSGANYWGDSNLRSWLNSDASAGNVNWLCGNPPDNGHVEYGNAYDQEAGFLSNFTQSERNAMKTVSQKSLLSWPEIDKGMATIGTAPHTSDYNSNLHMLEGKPVFSIVKNYDAAYAEYVTDTVFLLDVKQIYAVDDNYEILGGGTLTGKPTKECVENSECENKSIRNGLHTENGWFYWLRSPDSGFHGQVRNVNNYVYLMSPDGFYYGYNAAAAGEVGVRPAFYLNSSVASIQSGKGTEENPYTVTGSNTDAVGFADVAANAYYAAPVGWAVENKITSGTSATTFSPDATCNRAQILSFLWRANGSPEPTAANPFTDIKTTDYFYKAALWAAEKGMVSGSTFSANTDCTRASTMEYMWKAAGSPTPTSKASFTDVPANADYAQAVAWAVENEVTSGTGNNQFSPAATCTRGQIMTFLFRAMGK